MEGTHEDSLPGVDPSIGDNKLPKDAIGPYASSSWSDLPTDLLLSILQRLELRESFAFASVCTSWCSAAAAAGVPLTCRPWLMSWAHLVEKREAKISCSSAVTCKFRHLLDVNKSYDVDFPKGCFVACCGASHGWLVLVNELSNLVLFNPITTDMVPLPPITDFTFVEAVYDDQGSIQGYYLFHQDKLYHAKDVARWFYQKAVLSCTPSKGGNYIVMIIHYDSNWLSFVRAGESKWQVVSTLAMSGRDRFADCAYHNGRFYTVTYQGIVEKYELGGSNGPTKVAIIAHRNTSCVLTRHLVSTPWGDLLQVRAICAKRVENVRFDIDMVHPEGWKKVSPHDLMEHAVFVGLNHSTCLPAKKFPGLRPQCIYFSAPWMTHKFELMGRCRGWGGVRSYDIERGFKHAFPIEGVPESWSMSMHSPSELFSAICRNWDTALWVHFQSPLAEEAKPYFSYPSIIQRRLLPQQHCCSPPHPPSPPPHLRRISQQPRVLPLPPAGRAPRTKPHGRSFSTPSSMPLLSFRWRVSGRIGGRRTRYRHGTPRHHES